MKTPCKDCQERQLHCHSSCPKYAEYKQELADLEARKQAYDSEANFHAAEKSVVRAMWRKRK